MADKYQNKYRIASARAPWWNYGWNGAYFITICTHNRNHFFGKIVNGALQLSPVGALADQCWREIPNRFPYAQLDAWVVMPNHVHGIIMIDKSNPNFAWQTRFYDHIIRNNTAWNRIRTYIENNPANWKEDRFYLCQ